MDIKKENLIVLITRKKAILNNYKLVILIIFLLAFFYINYALKFNKLEISKLYSKIQTD